MIESDILFNVENKIGVIRLNRPHKKNAFTLDMIDQWAGKLEQWRTDPTVEVILLTGTKDSFCSGIDLGAIHSAGEEIGPFEQKSVLWERIHRVALTLEDIDKPVLAAVNGLAVGAGLDMALMCDIRFAADSAKMSEGYIRIGLVPGDGGAYFLPRLVGLSKALELLWTGDFIDGKEAMNIGLVSRVYPEDRLMEETMAFARRLAEGPTKVRRMIKRAVYQSRHTDLRTALDLISSHMGIVRYTRDHSEAIEAMFARMAMKGTD